MSKNRPADIQNIFTIGHGVRPLDQFCTILKSFAIDLVIDVRTIPRSRHNPQFNRETLPESLKPQEIGYIHQSGLGGLRKTYPDSPNKGWHNASFRGFADYMQTREFESSLIDVIEKASRKTTVLMCAETLPWRCHRSLIADALLVREIPVIHILKLEGSQPHKLTSFARVQGMTITYPQPEME
jgi:uncharacterized protein (DUF488 family)